MRLERIPLFKWSLLLKGGYKIMKTFFVSLAAALMLTIWCGAANSAEAGRVRGYYRSNGTYVQPHIRSDPDRSPYNNYSYPGNYNPYTGKASTGNPDRYLERYRNRKGGIEPYKPYYTPRRAE
jgi:hypothetical protein